MRSRAARLLSLLAAVAFALAPVAARAHLAATSALGLDLCTTPVDGKAPPSADHGEHCECCLGAAAAPQPAGTRALAAPGTMRLVGTDNATNRATQIPVPLPRGPPAGSFSTH